MTRPSIPNKLKSKAARDSRLMSIALSGFFGRFKPLIVSLLVHFFGDALFCFTAHCNVFAFTRRFRRLMSFRAGNGFPPLGFGKRLNHGILTIWIGFPRQLTFSLGIVSVSHVRNFPTGNQGQFTGTSVNHCAANGANSNEIFDYDSVIEWIIIHKLMPGT